MKQIKRKHRTSNSQATITIALNNYHNLDLNFSLTLPQSRQPTYIHCSQTWNECDRNIKNSNNNKNENTNEKNNQSHLKNLNNHKSESKEYVNDVTIQLACGKGGLIVDSKLKAINNKGNKMKANKKFNNQVLCQKNVQQWYFNHHP